jgi:hypothetical protein
VIDMTISLDQALKLAGVAGAIATFAWGVVQWRDKSSQDLRQQAAEAERSAQTRKIEATRPFLDRQLALYTEATQVAAKIATLPASEARAKAVGRFWELYWGELAMVENAAVEGAMKRFGEVLAGNDDRKQLQLLSLALAHACRESLDKAWGINVWTKRE